MSNFNWFSRSYDQDAEAKKAAEAEKGAAATPESASPQPKDAGPSASPEDYLAWAKAAYQNIQQQQQTAAASETAADTSEMAAADSSETVPAVSETQDTADVESSETATTADDMGEVAADVPQSESVSDTGTAAPPTGPAWMQSVAERQARLERLQETAIAEPEPEPAPEPVATPTATPADALPELDFDEAFLWSAEVLAGQGRRATDISLEEITWLNRLRRGLDKTRRGLVNQLKSIVGQGPLNEEAVFEIEALLLQADVGVEATDAIIEALQNRLRAETLPPEQAIAYLKSILRDMLDQPLGDTHNLAFVPEKDKLNIWLLTGVNGAGKTTTIGKLAHIARKSDYRCLIGAADTFRAAAVEQVKAWGARSGVDVVANPGKNTDPAAVVFDAIAAAQSRQTELLLIDTAGRLQNKKNLMDELSKVRRIIDKKATDANVESLLVLDATLGQNGLRQAQVFAEAANLSGVVLTKLDGTAKGGVALAVVQQLGLPIRFIGAGEGIEDLRPFSSYEFVEALLSG